MKKQTENKNEAVRRYIMDRIDSHVYHEGQIIESESRLCEILDVSRMTVRKALDELVSEGMIYKEKGRGTFVAGKPRYAGFRFGAGGFTQEAQKRGRKPSTRDAVLELTKADEKVAASLHVLAGEKVWKVSRVRCADDMPVIYVEEYFLYAHCPDLTVEIVSGSVYRHLEEKGIFYAFLDQKVEAVSCSADLAQKLCVGEGHPLIKMSVVIYMKNGTAYNCGMAYYRTDKYALIQSVYRGEI